MNIECPHCGNTGKVPDEKVSSAGLRLACPKCKTPFSVQKQASSNNGNAVNERQEAFVAAADFAVNQHLDPTNSDHAQPSKKSDRKQSRKSTERQESWGRRHLALLIFLATLSGSLLGAVGSLSEALNLLLPIWNVFYPAPKIRIVGSNTILGERLQMATEWETEFQELTAWQEEIPIIGETDRVYHLTIAPIGSLSGIKEAQKSPGDAHVLATSEPIPDIELERLSNQGVSFHCAAEIGYDLIVFVTDKNNPLPNLSREDLKKILTGEITNWSEINVPPQSKPASKPILVYARKGSGTTDVVLQALTGSLEFPSHFIECDSNADCLNQTVGTPGSLYWVSLSWLYTQPPDYMHVILVKRDDTLPATNPYDEDFYPDHYPPEFIRPLYMYVLKHELIAPETMQLAEDFFKYVRGVRGQKILEQHNFYTYFEPPADIKLLFPTGFGRHLIGPPVICR